MTPTEILEELKIKINLVTDLELILKTFINHYNSTTVEGCLKDEDGDMLLYQWGGPYSWDKYFSINLTRQFSFNDDREYVGMKQLRMDCKYLPTAIQIESGNFWFEGGEIEEYLKKIIASDAFINAKSLKIQSIEFRLNEV